MAEPKDNDALLPGEKPDIDWLLVRKRLVAWARRRLLFRPLATDPSTDLAIGGHGDGPEQIATKVWEDAYLGIRPLPHEHCTTEDVVRILIPHTNREFLNQMRRQRDGHHVMVWQTEAPLAREYEEIGTDADALERAAWRELRSWLLAMARSANDRGMLAYIELQCGLDGYAAYKPNEAATRLGVSLDEITNIKRRVHRLLVSRQGK